MLVLQEVVHDVVVLSDELPALALMKHVHKDFHYNCDY
jgi:hypothetical protein